MATGFEDIFGDFGEQASISNEIIDESGRKLLIFSDNRQEAAFFAGYLTNKHDQIMWRRLMLSELDKNPMGISIGALIQRVKVAAERNKLYGDYEKFNDVEKENIAARYVLKEFMELDKRTGLVGRGFVEIYPNAIPLQRGLWGLTPEESSNLLRFYMDTLRQAMAIRYPDELSYTDDFFAPKNHEVSFRYEKGNGRILGFMPAKGRKNRRSEFGTKIFGSEEQSKEAIDNAYTFFVGAKGFISHGYFIKKDSAVNGSTFAVDYNAWNIRKVQPDEELYVCSKCGKVASYSIKDKCSAYKCDGTLNRKKASYIQDVPYYHDLYADRKIIPMVAKEHTAQLDRKAAGDYQEKFEKGKINVLSCSTTFEMGVDVGELEATFLRNVPPETANYIQRAGRAGRRTSSTAFAVTFARRNSHDINFFNRPENIISGKINAPYIEIENDKIASRHINSIVLAWFFSRHSEFFESVENLLDGSADGFLETLKNELNNKPQDLMDAIKAVIPFGIANRLGVNDWSFADRLIGKEGSLKIAIERRNEDLKVLSDILQERVQNNRLNSINGLVRLINTYSKQRVINFLASTGVLPKYGFPVDVVELDVNNNSETAEQIELSRDLKMAISEYAPPAEIVANGFVWESYAINTVSGKAWPEEFFFECKKCRRIAPPDKNYLGSDDQDIANILKRCDCDGEMKLNRFITPIFGFSTSSDSKPKRVGDEKPKKFYASRTQFWGIDVLDSYQQNQIYDFVIPYNDKEIVEHYSPNGKLTVINRGTTGKGFFICKTCGFVSDSKQQMEHKNKYGRTCKNKYLSKLSLGHSFNSDILRIELPYYAQGKYTSIEQRTSTLYAILEGASDYLDIDRSDINGCLDFDHGAFAIILYDESAGGAGHVKRIAYNLDAVLRVALDRVSGSCGCSEDTSCYGCLRNYQNQFEHDILIRGAAKEYLEWLLK